MKLVRVNDPRPGQKLTCVKCGEFVSAERLVADLDGEAYTDYYCDPGCRPDNFEVHHG